MPKFKKGSQEAKDYMASIRKKKGSGANVSQVAHNHGVNLGDPVERIQRRKLMEDHLITGGSYTNYEQTPSQQVMAIARGSQGSNMNNGVMVVPQAFTPEPINIAGIAGANGVPTMTGRGYGQIQSLSYPSPPHPMTNPTTMSMTGRGVIDQYSQPGYISEVYDQSNLGANGYVSLGKGLRRFK